MAFFHREGAFFEGNSYQFFKKGEYMIGSFVLFAFTGLFACGDSTTESKKEEQKVVQNTSPKTEAPKEEKKTPQKEAPKPEQKTSFDPLAGKSLFEMCASNGLSLIKWPYAKRQAKEECCGSKLTDAQKEELMCELDWPSRDVPSCDIYDELRNTIFALHGREFSTAKWQKFFSKQSWYQPRKDYKDTDVGTVAMANVQLLIKMKKEKQGCIP